MRDLPGFKGLTDEIRRAFWLVSKQHAGRFSAIHRALDKPADDA